MVTPARMAIDRRNWNRLQKWKALTDVPRYPSRCGIDDIRSLQWMWWLWCDASWGAKVVVVVMTPSPKKMKLRKCMKKGGIQRGCWKLHYFGRRRWLPLRKSADKNEFQSQLVRYKLCTTCTGKWQVAFRPRLLGMRHYVSCTHGVRCIVHRWFWQPEELPFKLSVVMSLLRFCISFKLK